ncbi:MAG: cbb3-type cytochrome c oxidase subunit I [Porticoccus sp.]
MLFGLTSLGFGMLIAIALILIRSPFPGVSIFDDELFRVFLVLHVDLSILVWYLSFAGCLVTHIIGGGTSSGWFALGGSFLGTLLMLVAAVSGYGQPQLSNYLPVIDSPLFLVGLVVFLISALVSMARMFWLYNSWALLRSAPMAGFILYCAALIVVAALLTVCITYARLPIGIRDDGGFYEQLFWGAGHLFQSVYTLLMLVVWFLFVDRYKKRESSHHLWMKLLVLAMTLPALSSLWVAVNESPLSVEYRLFYTSLMRYSSWLAVPFSAVILIQSLLGSSRDFLQSLLTRTLLASVLLFAVGIIAGLLIRGDSLMVPAHYHGTTGAINLAFMAVVYQCFSKELKHQKFLRSISRQPIIYSCGLLLMVSGFAWSGYHGTLRKVAGVEQGFNSPAEMIGMLVAGVGGLLALFGLFQFIVTILFRLKAPTIVKLSVNYQSNQCVTEKPKLADFDE